MKFSDGGHSFQLKTMNFNTYISIFAILFVFNWGVGQDLEFTATSSKSSIGINQYIEVTYEINRDLNSFQMPNFEDFKVVNGPRQNSVNTFIAGEKSYKKSVSYTLKPLKQGHLTIQESKVVYQGNVFKSNPLHIEVTDAVAASKDSNDTAFGDRIHVVAEVDQATMALGDSISVHYILYVSKDMGVSGWEESEVPVYHDFKSENIEFEKNITENSTYQNKMYRSVIWRKTMLKPLSEGDFIIEPIRLQISAEIPSKKRDVFGGFVMESVTETLETKPILINVKS